MCVFFFNDTATTEIYTLSLHDALPISDALHLEEQLHAVRGVPDRARRAPHRARHDRGARAGRRTGARTDELDRKSTRLNSSHANISYAVFCLKKKKIKQSIQQITTTHH